MSSQQVSSCRDRHWFKFTQCCQKLGIQQCRSSSSTNRIVREDRKLPVKQRTRAKTPHDCCHAMTSHPVQSRLWAVICRNKLNGLGRSRWQILSGKGPKLLP